MLMETYIPKPTGGIGSTATLTEEDTWTDVIGPAGGSGLPALVPVNTVITGAAIVTAQTRVAGSSDAWQDIGDTAGASNGGTLLRPCSVLAIFQNREYRFGIKTGSLNGGSATITVG